MSINAKQHRSHVTLTLSIAIVIIDLERTTTKNYYSGASVLLRSLRLNIYTLDDDCSGGLSKIQWFF